MCLFTRHSKEDVAKHLPTLNPLLILKFSRKALRSRGCTSVIFNHFSDVTLRFWNSLFSTNLRLETTTSIAPKISAVL